MAIFVGRRSCPVVLVMIRTLMTCSPASAFVSSSFGARPNLALFSTLDQKTVKELKEILQGANLNERGLLTKLKRKQDLVEYLEKNLPQEGKHEESVPHQSEERPSPADDVVVPVVLDVEEAVALNVPKEFQGFPRPLQESLSRREITSLMPIQTASFKHIASGEDAVLNAPTGQGKTWAFCLPLAARIMTDPLLQSKAKGKHSSKRDVAVSPRILTLVPSRELARQVGKEWSKWTSAPVATVFGGVPLERHTNLLRKGGGAHVAVSTPGRWRELVREGHVDYKHIRVVVLDEADTMLDAADSPDVTAILEDVQKAVGDRESYEEQQYQMVLVSATVNPLVRNFAMDIMEIPENSKSFITVDRIPLQHSAASAGAGPAQTVQHWYTPVKTFVQPSVAADYISSLDPRLCIVFVPTKADTENVSTFLSQHLAGRVVRTLHGDMPQAQRSRTVSMIREQAGQVGSTQVLVATDVASRGLDLPNVDLVVQFGIPRVAGKEGTFNVELYTHRTGRAGRVGTSLTKSANAIMLYDPAVGEGKLLDELMDDVQYDLGVSMKGRPIPSSNTIVEAAYERAANKCFENDGVNPELVEYFSNRLQDELDIDTEKGTEESTSMLRHLSTAMALMANLNPSVVPGESHCSLITGDQNERTLTVYRQDGQPVTPTEVTKLCKSFGSGKLGRVIVTEKGNALLDLPKSRAKKLLENLRDAADEDWCAEMATSVPTDHFMITGRRRPDDN